MGDVIYRQEAIDMLTTECSWTFYDEHGQLTPNGEEILGTLKKMPSAQQWIPCSERLPEEEGEYLVTFNDKWYGPKVRILWYGTPFDIILDQDKWVFYCDQDYGFETFAPGKLVVAWMQMPKPYKDRHE